MADAEKGRFGLDLNSNTDGYTLGYNHGNQPDLHAAWRDPVVRAAHVYELGAITVVLVLMLAKPF